MNPLTIFGLFAVSAMVVCYALENRHANFILAFAFSCVLGIRLWILARCMALWRGGVSVVGHSRKPLVGHSKDHPI